MSEGLEKDSSLGPKGKKQWENAEKFDDPDIDGIVAHLCKVLGRLAADAEREYRS